jgi:hypothetical protein
MVTDATAGGLCTPKLSVTSKEKVTTPEVLGTVTKTLDAGAATMVVGVAGVRATVSLTGGGINGTGELKMGACGSALGAFAGFAASMDELIELGM